MSCSNDGAAAADVEGDAPATKMIRKPKLDSSLCIRCKTSKGVLVLRHQSYCSACLLPLLQARFARALNPAVPALSHRSPAPPKPSFVLACSGGSSSVAMLDLFHQNFCQSEGRTGRVRWERVVVAWVDFGREDGEEVRRYLEELCGRFEFEFVRVPVEDAFFPAKKELAIAVEAGRVLKTSLQSASSLAPSSYQSLLASLPAPSHPHLTSSILLSLLHRLAASLSTPTRPTLLLTGLSSTRSASLIISQLALGGGYRLPLLVQSQLAREGNVTEVRVMAGLAAKEIAWYVRHRGLRSWNFTAATEGAADAGKGKQRSIEQLTEDFVQTLDSTHPSTVSTIARTASKITFSGSPHSSASKASSAAAASAIWAGPICPLCEMPADPSPKEWLARTSLTSLPIPSSSSSTTPSSPLPSPSIVPSASSAPPPSDGPPLEASLCYACLTCLVSPAGAAGGGPAAAPPPGGHPGAALPFWALTNLRRDGRRARELAVGGDARASGEQPGKARPGGDVEAKLKDEGWLLSDSEEDEDTRL